MKRAVEFHSFLASHCSVDDDTKVCQLKFVLIQTEAGIGIAGLRISNRHGNAINKIFFANTLLVSEFILPIFAMDFFLRKIKGESLRRQAFRSKYFQEFYFQISVYAS